MPVIRTTKNAQDRTLTVVAEFDATPERVWGLWEDARQLEKWWGPPMRPATFTRHEFVPGGESRYSMAIPDGSTSKGYWKIEAIDTHRRVDFANGLAGDDGEPVPGVEPMAGHVTFEKIATGTRMTVLTRFVDVAQMETMLKMGMEEGMSLAMGQIDSLLVAAPSGVSH